MSDEDRLTKIEIMLGHQDRQIQDLSDVLAAQRKEIDILTRRLDRTQAKLLEAQAGQGEGSDNSLSVTEQAARDNAEVFQMDIGIPRIRQARLK